MWGTRTGLKMSSQCPKQKFERTSENLENYCLMSLLKEIQNYMTPWTQNTKKCEMSQDCYTVMYNP